MSLVLNVEILGEFKKLTAATKGSEKALGNLQKTTKNISSKINGSLALIGVGFSMTAVVRGINETLEAASDLQQQFGALDSVFKNIAPEMKTFAESLTPLGLSSADASRNMALLGAQLKGFGLPLQETSVRTKELTLLAADLAATFGGTTSDAVAAIGSLFRGEFDPIERFGVAIKKSDINARLLAEGLNDLEGEALKQAEAQAALTMLFEKTTDAQGQAARESESYASQQAYLRAESENLKAEIGEALLPVMVELFKEIRDNLPEIKEFISQLLELLPVIVDLAIASLDYKEQILGLTTALAALKIGVALLTGIGGLGGLKIAMMGVFANPVVLAWAAGIAIVVGALSNLKTEANAARDAVNALERAKASASSSTGIPYNPGNTSYAPYDYVTPPTKSEGIAGQSKLPIAKNVGVTSPTGSAAAGKATAPIVQNVTVNVKNSNSSGATIAKAVSREIRTVGTNVIRAI